MGLLDSFEKGLERAVNGAFVKTFRSGVQPVEIASALRSELDKKAAVVSRDRILVPNTFTVRLSEADAERMRTVGPTLLDELRALVEKHAKDQGYSFPGAVTVTLNADATLSTGVVRVESSSAAGAEVSWQAVLDIDGTRHPIRASRTVIGRGSDADITIPDAGTSRKHVEILWDGNRAMVRDLGSTNGTQLNGVRVDEAPLPVDGVVRIGRTDIAFHVVPQAARPARPTMSADEATRMFDTRGGDAR